MDPLIQSLREFKEKQQGNLKKGEAIIDIVYYGKLNTSKNDTDLSNIKQEDLYLVKKEENGKQVLEFQTDYGVVAKVGENGTIQISEQYRKFINEKEFLLQLEKVMPISLEKLEEIEQRKQKENTEKIKNNTQTEKQIDSKKTDRQKKYIENPKDAKIDMNKKITETKTFAELVPEVRQKGIIDVRVRRIDNTKFEIIGIDNQGYEIPLETLEQTEGTNPSKNIIKVNGDGSEVEKEQVMTMLKIKNGENQSKQNEGFTINLGTYGIPEVQYYRRAAETNEYTSIPVNLENTNQKITDKDVREYMEQKRNATVKDNVEKAEDRIEYNEDEQTQLENIDDDKYNDKVVDSSEILIRKAAARCKMSVEGFKEELDKAEGDTLEEKIENAEEEINEAFRRA